MITIYLAGPLFTAAERQFNLDLANEIRQNCKTCKVSVILPQVKADELKDDKDFKCKIYSYCLQAIDKSDLVLAILDGPDADSGTCIEMGYAYARKKPVIGIRTDLRSSEDRGVNLMVSNICNAFIWQPCATISGLAPVVIKTVDQIITKTDTI